MNKYCAYLSHVFAKSKKIDDKIMLHNQRTGLIELKNNEFDKNYLYWHLKGKLNRIVTMYLDYAEDQAKMHRQIYMRNWREKLDAFLQFNEREVLENAGKVEKAVADKLALDSYEEYNAKRLEMEAQNQDKEDLKMLEDMSKSLSKDSK